MRPDPLNFAMRLEAAEDGDIDPETFEKTFGPREDDTASYAGSAIDEDPLPTRLPVPMRSINQPSSPKPFAPDETGSIISFFRSTNGYSSPEEQSVAAEDDATSFAGTSAPEDEEEEVAPEHDFDETGKVSDAAKQEVHDAATCQLLSVPHQVLAVWRLLRRDDEVGDRARAQFILPGSKYSFPLFTGINPNERTEPITMSKTEFEDMVGYFKQFGAVVDPKKMTDLQFMQFSSLRGLCVRKCAPNGAKCIVPGYSFRDQLKHMREVEHLKGRRR